MTTLSFLPSSPDNRGNFVVENNSLVISENLEALKEKIDQRLRFFLGEWVLDTQIGIPYFEIILERPDNADLIINIINQDIYKEPDVTNIDVISFDFDREKRTFSYEMRISTIFGETTQQFSGIFNG